MGKITARNMGTKILFLLGLGLALNACKGSGISQSDVLKPVYTKEDKFIDPNEYCPKTVLRGGTENFRAFPAGQKGNLARLKLQATILKVARECHYKDGQLLMKVGVAGRFIPGPQRNAANANLPIRVVVRRGDQTIYSKLHQRSVALNGGQNFGKFQFIDDTISIDAPSKKNIQVIVGFDEGPNK